jgi:predicted ATPase/DNA-binding SARP family transcriptional activator
MSPSPLTIRLFGPFTVLVDGQPLPRLRTRSVEWLLALLILRHGRAVERDWLAGTFWPESTETAALKNLRNDLSTLRKALGREVERLRSPGRDLLTLDLEGADVDLLRFDAALRAGDEASLREAATVYAGPLLEGCFEDWVAPEREARAHAFLGAVETLADRAEARAEYNAALELVARAAAIDPLRDSIQRRRMRLLDSAGDAPAAVLAYRDFRLRLHREMNIEPDLETTRLFQEIRARARQRASSSSSGTTPDLPHLRGDPDDPPASLHASTLCPRPSTPAPLPHALTSLIGREEELVVLRERLRSQQLVTLVGAGGVGKTRLAVEAAAAERGGEAEPVFISLAPLTDPEMVETFVAAALGLSDSVRRGPQAPLLDLVGWFSTHRALLVLDNCEHLIDAAANLVQCLLERCPDLRILATSRQRLGLMGESVWRVSSLAGPDPDSLPTDPDACAGHVGRFPAVRLFLERAAQVHPGFRLSGPQDALAVARICRRLDGVPLAIELAAARTAMLTPRQIEARLADRFALLTGGSRAALPRQQSLRALIDWSYDLCTEEERALLRRLTVFAGSWTLEAAEAVAEAQPFDLLSSLVERSLVIADAGTGSEGTGSRFRMLETIREYCLERLRLAGDEVEARRRHLAWCVRTAEEMAELLAGPAERDGLAALDAERDNFRAAFAWVQQDEAVGEEALRLAAALWPYWDVRGTYAEGVEYLRESLARPVGPNSDARAQGLLGMAMLSLNRHDRDGVHERAAESLERFRALGDPRGIADALLCVGRVKALVFDWAAARDCWAESAAWYDQCCWKLGRASALIGYGRAVHAMGDAEGGRASLREALGIAEAAGNDRLVALALFRLGRIERSRPAVALPLVERSLALSLELGHRRFAADCYGTLAVLERWVGSFARAVAHHERAIALWRDLGDRDKIGWELVELGNGYCEQGQFHPAADAYRQALELFRQTDTDPDRGWGVDTAAHFLGLALFRLGARTEAAALHREALDLYLRREKRVGVVWTVERLGLLEALQGDPQRGVLLMGAAAAGREALGDTRKQFELEDWEAVTADLGGRLGQERFEELLSKGRAIPLEEAAGMLMQPTCPGAEARPE